MQTSLAVEQKKILNGPRVRGISPVGKEKVCTKQYKTSSCFFVTETTRVSRSTRNGAITDWDTVFYYIVRD